MASGAHILMNEP